MMHPLPWLRLDLDEIARSIQLTAGLADAGVLGSTSADEPMTPETLANVFEGFRFIDTLLASRTEIFRYGRSGVLLELNHIVLCGTDPERRAQYARHLAETERAFYEEREGIGAFHDWFQRHAAQPPRALAAGVFAYLLSAPQLFIEGNSRTAALLAGYLLARGGLPPLVVTPRWLGRYREAVGRCSAIRREAFAGGLAVTRAAHQVEAFLAESADPRFLAGQLETAPEAPAAGASH
jgi:hypothetical protein